MFPMADFCSCKIGIHAIHGNKHRREWIEARILKLSQLFSIDVYSYAVMHNHYHLVVYFDPKAPFRWSDREVAERWLKLFPIRKNHPRYESAHQAKLLSVMNSQAKLGECRQRLGSISWLMRCINEPIAKQSNAEDFVKGHFWDRLLRPAKPAYITSL